MEQGRRQQEGEMVRWEDATSISITTLTALHYGMINLNISHLNSRAQLSREDDFYVIPSFLLMKTSKAFSRQLLLNYILASPWACVARFEAFRKDLIFCPHQFCLTGFSP